jgi:serine/threonine protein kinase
MTLEYAPPEVVFGSKTWSGGATITPDRLHSYDIWSVGVVFLELIMGSPHVFQLSPGTQRVLDAKLQLGGRSQGERQLIYLLRGMMELCIYPPQVSQGLPALTNKQAFEVWQLCAGLLGAYKLEPVIRACFRRQGLGTEPTQGSCPV